MNHSVYLPVCLFFRIQISLVCTMFIFLVFCGIAIADSSQDSSCKNVLYEFAKLTYSALIWAIGLFVVTVVTYKRFIKSYLMEIECYKQRLLRYHEIYAEIVEMECQIEPLKSDINNIDEFYVRYMSFITRNDRLFISEDIKNQFDHIKGSWLIPTEYPDPPATLAYDETPLPYIENAFRSLRQKIENEIEKRMKQLK